MSQKQTPITVNTRRPSNGNGAQTLRAFSGELDELEKNSVRALVAYAAMNTGKPEKEIQQNLSARFTVADIDHLASRSYEDAIKFLVDMCDENEEPDEGVAK